MANLIISFMVALGYSNNVKVIFQSLHSLDQILMLSKQYSDEHGIKFNLKCKLVLLQCE